MSTNNHGANKNFKNKEEFEAKKAEQLAKQQHNLEMINGTVKYLNTFLVNSAAEAKAYVAMKDILTYLNTNLDFAVEDTKVISQYNYLLMDLANCRKNTRVSGDRLNIRVLYIIERFKTSFKSELHGTIDNMINENDVLFAWDDNSTGENYNVDLKKDEKSNG